MTAPTLYLWLPGTARDALDFYQSVFGGEVIAHTFGEFGRTDGPAHAIAHGMLNGPVSLYCTDAADGEPALNAHGLSVALLGTAEPEVLHSWFAGLAVGGVVLDPLSEKPWNASDGQLVDRFGLRWLIGYEH